MASQNYILLERIELNTTTVASVNFTNIPQSGYTDLKIVVSGRNSTSVVTDLVMKFNGSSTGYSQKYVIGTGVSAVSGTQSYGQIGIMAGNSTANTFAINETYIFNYTSSNYKLFSSDDAYENYGSQAYTSFWANQWANSAAITSIEITSYSGSFVQYCTFSLYGLAAVGTTPVIAPKASGGSITTDGTYWIHTFNTTDAFIPYQALSCDYLVVAGGGGAVNIGGGGGAGGLRSTVTATGGGGSLETAFAANTGTTYTITVGAGAAGVTNGSWIPGNSGNNSSISGSGLTTITSVGGGGGGSWNTVGGTGNNTGRSGGSGGGSTSDGTGSSSGGSGTSNQGYAGGNDAGGAPYGGGGGGGAGGSGVGRDSSTNQGNGGEAVGVAITGSTVYYAGGGGGGVYRTGTQSLGGGTATTSQKGGGGDAGATSGNNSGTSGTANTGGGGGGGYNNDNYPSGTGASGGSGIVIIRYAMA